MLLLRESDLRALLTMREVIEAVASGFGALARGEAIVPDRLQLGIAAHQGVLLEMPAYTDLSGAAALGTKVVTVFEQNGSRGLDIVQAVYLLLDYETGVPLALMDGRFITAVRTAATSAVATRFMAAPAPKRLAVFGAGVQAQFHIEAMIEVAEIAQVLIVSRSADRAQALVDRFTAVHALPCDLTSTEKAVTASNLICTCTSSPLPLFDGRLLNAGTHINAIGAFSPSTREIDTEGVRRARTIIDAESAAGREAGEVLIPLSEGVIDQSHVKGTLAEVVSGKVAGRETPSEITLFKSCGLAIEDLVTARLAYAKALDQGLGVEVALS